MHRSHLLDLLSSYTPITEEELVYKDKIIEFVKEHRDCFERTNNEGHITASAWLLNNDAEKALLMHHAKLDDWFQLGGHCDGDPNVLEVAIKEAQEESGIASIEPVSNKIFDIDIHVIPSGTLDKEHYHYDIRFLLKVQGEELTKHNKESKELRWIGKNIHELPSHSRSLTRMFDKWLKKAI